MTPLKAVFETSSNSNTGNYRLKAQHFGSDAEGITATRTYFYDSNGYLDYNQDVGLTDTTTAYTYVNGLISETRTTNNGSGDFVDREVLSYDNNDRLLSSYIETAGPGSLSLIFRSAYFYDDNSMLPASSVRFPDNNNDGVSDGNGINDERISYAYNANMLLDTLAVTYGVAPNEFSVEERLIYNQSSGILERSEYDGGWTQAEFEDGPCIKQPPSFDQVGECLSL